MMSLRVYWLLLVNLVVNVSAESVYSHHTQYGPGKFAESEPATSRHQPLTSTGGSNDPLFQAASSSGLISQRARVGFLQMADDSPDFAPTLYSSPLISRSNLVKNVQSVVMDKNAVYEPSNSRIASYGSVYRLLKSHGAFSTVRTAPSMTFKLSSSSSEPNNYKVGFSNYDGTRLKDVYNSAAHISRKKPSLSSMAISSGPIIRFVMPNQSNDLLEQTTNEALSSFIPDASIKPATDDRPPSETSKPFESQGMTNYRSTSQPQAQRSSESNNKPNNALKHHSTLLRTTKARFTQHANDHTPADTTFNPFTVFKPAQITHVQQTAKLIQKKQQLSDSLHDLLYDSSFTSSPFISSGYRFRPVYTYGTSTSRGTTVNVPSSNAKTNRMQDPHAGLSLPKVGFGPSSSVLPSGDLTYGFPQPENVYTSDPQPTAGNSELFHNPYFKSRQSPISYSTFNSLMPNNTLPTWHVQKPSKSFNAPISQKLPAQNSRPDPNPDGDQRKYPQKLFQSRPYTPNSLFHYLSGQPFPNKHSLSHLQVGKSDSNLADNDEIQSIHSSLKPMHSYTSSQSTDMSQRFARLRSDSDRASNGYALDQINALVKPSQPFARPLSSISGQESQPVSPESWHGPSQPNPGFSLIGSRPVQNFQKIPFTRSEQV